MQRNQINLELTLYLIETTLNAFANKADPDQAALVSCLIMVYSVAYENMIYLILHNWT